MCSVPRSSSRTGTRFVCEGEGIATEIECPCRRRTRQEAKDCGDENRFQRQGNVRIKSSTNGRVRTSAYSPAYGAASRSCPVASGTRHGPLSPADFAWNWRTAGPVRERKWDKLLASTMDKEFAWSEPHKNAFRTSTVELRAGEQIQVL
jgi:hypothetical protein